MIAGDRILVVDDSDSVRRILAEALEGEGYRVYTASDGRRAWDLLRQYPFFYDLVISDVMMPAMNGLELLRRTIANFPWGRCHPDQAQQSGGDPPNASTRPGQVSVGTVLPSEWCTTDRLVALFLAVTSAAWRTQRSHLLGRMSMRRITMSLIRMLSMSLAPVFFLWTATRGSRAIGVKTLGLVAQ
jgi:CheY-like chemotaxis protein